MPASDPGPPGSPGAGERRRWILRCIAAGLVHAILMWAAFPPADLWPCVILAPAPLVWLAVRLAERPPHPRRRLTAAMALLAWVSLGVLPFCLYEQQWVIDVSELGYFPLAVAMSLFPGFFVVFLRRVRRVLPFLPVGIAAPVLWIALEVFRGEIAFSGYPWYLLAHPLIACSWLTAPAAVAGTYAISFLVAIPSGAAADLLWIRP